MSGLFGIGTSALLANQRALAVTGNNIANANTDGYSRQRVEFNALQVPGSSLGSGVETNAVLRYSDAFANQRLVMSTSRHAELQTGAELARRLDLQLSDPATGLAGPLSQFVDAVDAWAANPAAPETRVQVLGQAESLAQRFDQLQSGLDSFQRELNSRISGSVDDINNLSASIAAINNDIARSGYGGSGAAPNDLLDQRDQLVRQLASQIDVQTTQLADGSVNVYVGNGQALVVGSDAASLSAVPGATPNDPVAVSIAGANISQQPLGGALGGLLGFRAEVLQPAGQQLRDIALGVVDTVNTGQANGSDADGLAGTALFSISSSSARISVEISDPDRLAAAAAGAAPGSGDNRNALDLAAALRGPVLGNDSLSEANIALVGEVGSSARRLEAAETAQGSLLQQHQNLRDEVSGVNLDEEAANLLRYQQAYQAAAQIIATADEMFESLLAAAR